MGGAGRDVVEWVAVRGGSAAAGASRRAGVAGVFVGAGVVSEIGSRAGLRLSLVCSRVTVKSLGRAVEVEVSVKGSMGCRGCGCEGSVGGAIRRVHPRQWECPAAWMVWHERQQMPSKLAIWRVEATARSGVVCAAMVVPGKAASRSRIVKPSSAVESMGLAVRGVCVTGKSAWVSDTAAAVEEV